MKRTFQERLELAYFEGYQDGARHLRTRNPYSLPRGTDPVLDRAPRRTKRKSQAKNKRDP